MTVNPVGSYPLAGVDFSISGQSGTTYKTNLDGAILAGKRIHNAFAPHELNQPLVAYDNTDVTPGTDIITVVGHTLVNGMAVKNVNDQEPSDPPAPLVDAVTYYVVGVAGNDFQLAATVGGAAIDLTDAGTGANVLTPQTAMFVQLDAGFVWDGSTLTEKALQTTAIIVKPSANPRIDRITVNPTTGVFTLTAGAENASPVPPAIPAGNFPNCQIALTTSTTAISNVEITDERALWISDAIPSIEKGAASGVASLDANQNVVEPIAAGGSVGLKVKVLEIGDWDMVGSSTATVSHGVAQANIRSVDVVIRDDVNTTFYDLGRQNGSGTGDGGITITSATIILFRQTSGYFHTTDFDSTSFNRGWVTIWYED